MTLRMMIMVKVKLLLQRTTVKITRVVFTTNDKRNVNSNYL